jgi:hypothetical protein
MTRWIAVSSGRARAKSSAETFAPVAPRRVASSRASISFGWNVGVATPAEPQGRRVDARSFRRSGQPANRVAIATRARVDAPSFCLIPPSSGVRSPHHAVNRHLSCSSKQTRCQCDDCSQKPRVAEDANRPGSRKCTVSRQLFHVVYRRHESFSVRATLKNAHRTHRQGHWLRRDPRETLR